MVTHLLIWAANGCLLALLSYATVRSLSLGQRSLNAVAFAFSWIFYATLLVFAVGFVGWLDVGHLGWVTLAGAALFIAIPGGRDGLRSFPKDLKSVWRAGLGWLNSLPVWLKWFLAVWAAVGVVRFAFVILVYPPFVWDSLTYHLTNVAAWTQKGAIFIPNTPVSRTYLPANYETLTTWFTVFLHDDIVVEASGLAAYAVELLGVYALARAVGGSTTASTLAAVGLGWTPSILLTATGTKNDPFMAGYFIALMALTVSVWSIDLRSKSPEILHRLVVMAMIIFVAAGTKAYVAHMLSGLALVALMMAHSAGGKWTAVFRPLMLAWSVWKACPPGRKLLILGLLLGALVLGGYWNTRNWILTGDPFYPYGVSLEGRTVISGAANQFHLSFGRMFENLVTIFTKLGDGLGPIQPDLPNTTGWGWFAYVLGLPSLVWSLWKHSKLRYVFSGFLVAALAILMSTRPSPFNMRYIVWFPAVLALAFAVAYDGLWIRGRGLGRFAAIAFVATVSLNVPMTITQNLIRISDVTSMLKLPALHRDAARFHVHVPEEYENALNLVPNNALMGYNVTNNGFIYPLYRADFSQRIVFIPFTAEEDCQLIADLMMQRGTRYLFVAPEQTDDAKLGVLNACGLDGTYLRERARGVYVLNDR